MAREEGYIWIADIFGRIAGNELAHARAAYKKFLCQIKGTGGDLSFSVEREGGVIIPFITKNWRNAARVYECSTSFFSEKSIIIYS